MNPERVATIVLAGGRGERLGRGIPKALVPLAGRTFLERALALARALGGPVFVAAPGDLALPLPEGVVRVHDREDGAGPLAGLVRALELALAAGAKQAVVLAVDLPLLTPRDVRALARAAGPDALAAVPATGRGLEPQLAFVADVATVRAAFDAAWNRGERSLQRAFTDLGPALVTLDAADPDAFPGGPAVLAGVNTPADFERAERALAAEAGGS